MSEKPDKPKNPALWPMIGVKMDKNLTNQVKRRCKQKHQKISDYVRQLIVADLKA